MPLLSLKVVGSRTLAERVVACPGGRAVQLGRGGLQASYGVEVRVVGMAWSRSREATVCPQLLTGGE